MPSALWWKRFYTQERQQFGEARLESLVREAPAIVLPKEGALLFPHTRLEISGHQTAAAARAVIESGCEMVVAIGVLHGGREHDGEVVQRARAGDAGAVALLRGIHGPGVGMDTGIWTEEFSLDNFEVMLQVASKVLDAPLPKLIKRYPILSGSEPETLPGFSELSFLIANGARLVATADMIHHGAGYNTPEGLCRSISEETMRWATQEIEASLAELFSGNFSAFLRRCAEMRSDFRDGGPLVASLIPNARAISVDDLTLVDYSGVLRSAEPTWVAAALATITS